ncbi:MAG: hypothetical protein KTR21_06000 [Rhodobacteraceae bacterium]|nr:hypothetical protein [Paracoccaceae bacterium]
MSKTGSPTPWSIKGIGPEAREAAKAAAKREGMTLGAWLSERVIAESEGGDSEPVSPKAGGAAAGVIAPDIILSALNEHLTGLSDRLDGMAAEVSRVSGAVDQAGMRVEVAERAATEIAQSVSQTVTGSISELIENRADQGAADQSDAGLFSAEAAESLADVITKRVTETVNADLSNKIEQSMNAQTMEQSVSAAVMRTLTPAMAEQLNRSIAPVTARLDRLDAASTDSPLEDALTKISTRIDEALTRQQEIAGAVGEAVAVLAQRLDAMESAVLAELEDQALQSQSALTREIDLTPPARKWLHEGGDVWAETDEESEDTSLHLSQDATQMFKHEPEEPDEMMRLDVAAVRARLGQDRAEEEPSGLKDSLSSLKDLLPDQEHQRDLDATESVAPEAPSHEAHEAAFEPDQGETALSTARPDSSAETGDVLEMSEQPGAAEEAPADESAAPKDGDQAPSIEDLVQDAVSQYSVLQRMSEEARRLTNDKGAAAAEVGDAQPQEEEQLDSAESENITERNRRLDRELDLELQRALALKPDPTIATTLDLGGAVDDHLEFKPRTNPTSSPQMNEQDFTPAEEEAFQDDQDSEAKMDSPARRMGPRIADLLADRIENLAPLREQAQRQPPEEPRGSRRFAADEDHSSSPSDHSFGADRSDRSERTAHSESTPKREMKLSQSRDLVAVFDEVEMWSDLDDASAVSRARSASLVLLGAGSLVAAFSAMYGFIGA